MKRRAAGFFAVVLLVGSAGAEEEVCLTRPGTEVYAEWCARCHGDAGDGRGPAGVALAFNGRAPRDFSAGEFRIRSTPSGTAPTDDDLRRTIERGLPGTAMPYFADLLSPAEIDAVIEVVRGFARSAREVGAPIDLGEEPAETPERLARGASLYGDLGCPVCHGEDGAGRAAAAELRNEDGTAALPPDLRRPWTFRGGGEARDVAMRLATGLAGTPMPSYRDVASDDALWAVAQWIRSRRLAPSLREAAIAEALRPAGGAMPLARRGESLAKSGTCFLCHVQMEESGAYREGSFGAGGMKVGIPSLLTVSTRNLTPDPETGLGRWTAADLGRALRDGRSRDGRRLGTLDMPWTIFRALTDRDVEALHAYLRSLPPVRNAVPPPEAPSLVDGIFAKIALVAGGGQVKAGFFPGNTGSENSPATAPVYPRAFLVAAVAAVVLAVVVAWLLLRGRVLLAVVVSIPLAGAWAYLWPPLELLPTSLVAADPSWGRIPHLFNFPPIRPPPPPLAIEDVRLRALAERGRYVATVGTCSLCHTAGPSLTRLYADFPEMGGGMRVNWRVFGTTFSRNLTPEPETGLGRWSDAEIRRAFTAGIARDGRRMHWQAMPWDHFSNLSLEDQEALVFYLRSLPPRRSKVPDPLPPSPADEPADTFFFGYSGELGP